MSSAASRTSFTASGSAPAASASSAQSKAATCRSRSRNEKRQDRVRVGVDGRVRGGHQREQPLDGRAGRCLVAAIEVSAGGDQREVRDAADGHGIMS